MVESSVLCRFSAVEPSVLCNSPMWSLGFNVTGDGITPADCREASVEAWALSALRDSCCWISSMNLGMLAKISDFKSVSLCPAAIFSL